MWNEINMYYVCWNIHSPNSLIDSVSYWIPPRVHKNQAAKTLCLDRKARRMLESGQVFWLTVSWKHCPLASISLNAVLRFSCHPCCFCPSSNHVWPSGVNNWTVAGESACTNSAWQLDKLRVRPKLSSAWDSSLTIRGLEMMPARKNVYDHCCANFIIHLLIICNWRAGWNSSNSAWLLTGELSVFCCWAKAECSCWSCHRYSGSHKY